VKKKLKSFSKVKLFSISFNFRFAAADESISSLLFSKIERREVPVELKHCSSSQDS